MSENKKYLYDSFDEEAFDDEFIIDDPLINNSDDEKEDENGEVDFFSIPETGYDNEIDKVISNDEFEESEEYNFTTQDEKPEKKKLSIEAIKIALSKLKDVKDNVNLLELIKKGIGLLLTIGVILLIMYALIFNVIKPLIVQSDTPSPPKTTQEKPQKIDNEVAVESTENTLSSESTVEQKVNPLYPILFFTENAMDKFVENNTLSYKANLNYSLNNTDKSKYRNDLKVAIDEKEKYLTALLNEELNFYNNDNDKLFKALYRYAKFTQDRDILTLKQLTENENRVTVIKRVNASHEEESALAQNVLKEIISTLEFNQVEYKTLEQMRYPEYFVQYRKIAYKITKYYQ